MIRFILVDIEGTTTSIDFVFEVLFPYFRQRVFSLKNRLNEPAIAQILDQVKQWVATESQQHLDDHQAIAQLHQWSVEDRKVAPLKAVQGLLWEEGYHQGDFQGHVYGDVPPQLERWHQQGIILGVYSSGSEQAQKLLFFHSEKGDLTPYFRWHFDLKVGQKRETQSYISIAKQTQISPAQILFLSDVEAELDAAHLAGFHTLQLVRSGTIPTEKHPTATRFDEIDLGEFS